MIKDFNKTQKIFFIVLVVIVLIAVSVALGILPGLKKKQAGNKKIDLEFWGIDSEENYQDVFSGFYQVNPDVRINYKQINEKNYESELIDALASRRGPDILIFKNSWTDKHLAKLYPAPADLISLKELQEGFPEAVYADMQRSGKIYGLPLSFDSLVLFYNKDIFNGFGLALPPATWQEFQNISRNLTEKKSNGEIKRSGAAFGTSENINRASDILTALMIQAGALDSASNKMNFSTKEALQAFDFYLSFSNPGEANYCWNENMSADLDAFSQSQTAMMVGYFSDRKEIEKRNPYLNFGTALLPQAAKDPASAKSLANYWSLGVSASSDNLREAWGFLIYAANAPVARKYVLSSGQPPANRILIKEFSQDEKIGILSKQALSAKSWIQIDPEKNSQILRNMIESVIRGRLSSSEALNKAEDDIEAVSR